MKLSFNILLVDDNRVMQNIHRSLIERLGHKATLAYSGSEAIDLCQHHVFDAILMDMQMPLMNGIETTQALRKNGCRAPIISVTGNDDTETQQACLNAGMNAFCNKPLSINQLQTQLETLLG